MILMLLEMLILWVYGDRKYFSMSEFGSDKMSEKRRIRICITDNKNGTYGTV
jgi:hypothetical protein